MFTLTIQPQCAFLRAAGLKQPAALWAILEIFAFADKFTTKIQAFISHAVHSPRASVVHPSGALLFYSSNSIFFYPFCLWQERDFF